MTQLNQVQRNYHVARDAVFEEPFKDAEDLAIIELIGIDKLSEEKGIH